MKSGMYVYIMAPEPVSAAYFISPSHQSACLCVYVPIIARQRLGKNVTAATNESNNRIIVGRVVFYAVCVISRKVGD
jgi:hypothetical protein